MCKFLRNAGYFSTKLGSVDQSQHLLVTIMHMCRIFRIFFQVSSCSSIIIYSAQKMEANDHFYVEVDRYLALYSRLISLQTCEVLFKDFGVLFGFVSDS